MLTVVNSAGTYTVTVENDANGCTDQASIAITVNNAAPTATITNNSGSTEVTCSLTGIDFTAGGGTSYSWNNGLGSSANQVVSSAGTYTVTVENDANGCTDQASIAITVNNAAPTATIANNSSSSSNLPTY